MPRVSFHEFMQLKVLPFNFKMSYLQHSNLGLGVDSWVEISFRELDFFLA